MQCEAFETRLNQILDDRLRPELDDGLLAHAQVCEACRDRLAVQEFLYDGVELLETPELSPGFAQRVVAGLSGRHTPCAQAGLAPPRRRPVSLFQPRWLALAAAVAAVLVVAVFAAPRFFPRPAVAPQPGILDVANQGATSPAAGGKLPESNGAPPGDASAVPRQDNRDLWEDLANRFPPMPRDSMESVEQIPGGLRPIATSFNTAIGLLRRTLPGGKDEPAAPPKPQAFYPRGEWLERTV